QQGSQQFVAACPRYRVVPLDVGKSEGMKVVGTIDQRLVQAFDFSQMLVAAPLGSQARQVWLERLSRFLQTAQGYLAAVPEAVDRSRHWLASWQGDDVAAKAPLLCVDKALDRQGL